MKKTLDAAAAAKLLQQEFARLKPAECKSCKAPVPYWGPGILNGMGYWYVRMIPPCEYRCNRVISKIWADLTNDYEIKRSEAESGQARFQGALRQRGTGAQRKQFSKRLREA
jgi:hypothetical protein